MISDNCENKCLPCPDSFGLAVLNVPGHPLANLSSEAPDYDLFAARRFQDLGRPPLGRAWFSIGCLGFCFSSVSQEDADLCAQRMANECTFPDFFIGDTPRLVPGYDETGSRLFYNNAMSAFHTCPDGTIQTIYFPPGLITGLNQEEVDIVAQGMANLYAAGNYLCAPAMDFQPMCHKNFFDHTLFVSSGRNDILCRVIAGQLPPGLTLTKIPGDTTRFRLFGTPTVPGDYTFTLEYYQASNPNFNATKQYALHFFGLENPYPPDIIVGQPYLHRFKVVGANEQPFDSDGPQQSPPYTYQILNGDIPDGMTFDAATGFLIGTTQQAGDSAFTLRVKVGNAFCDYDIMVKATTDAIHGGECEAIVGWGVVLNRHGVVNFAFNGTNMTASASGDPTALPPDDVPTFTARLTFKNDDLENDYDITFRVTVTTGDNIYIDFTPGGGGGGS